MHDKTAFLKNPKKNLENFSAKIQIASRPDLFSTLLYKFLKLKLDSKEINSNK